MIPQLADLRRSLPPAPDGKNGWPWTVQAKPFPQSLPDGTPWPRVSVVTPSYMQGAFLEETLRSVLMQGYPNLEYIVIDGGSSDSSTAILERYSPYLTYWVSEKDQGQAHAINKGFQRSTGHIMGYLNSDDMLLPNALFHVVMYFFKHPRKMIASGFRKSYDRNTKLLGNYTVGLPTNANIKHYCPVAQEATFWRRTIWEDVGPLNENFHFAMDYEYWLRIIEKGYIFGIIPYYIGGFRDHGSNKTATWRDVQERDLRMLAERYHVTLTMEELKMRLGKSWAQYYRLLSAKFLRRISNYPRMLIYLEPILRYSILGRLILILVDNYFNYRNRFSKRV